MKERAGGCCWWLCHLSGLWLLLWIALGLELWVRVSVTEGCFLVAARLVGGCRCE